MRKKKINDILDKWDPIGVNLYSKGESYGEYSKYVNEIIEIYEKGGEILDYLINLYCRLVDYPNESAMNDTISAADEITRILGSRSQNF